MSTNDSERYNGWANRETWAVALHINNDQGWQESVLEAVRTAVAGVQQDPSAFLGDEIPQTYLASVAGDAIKEDVEDTLGLIWSGTNTQDERDYWQTDFARVREDIGSLWRVDWTELGAAFLDDVTEEGDATNEDLDTTSSASRQHYIDTGEYLRRGEAEED